MADATDAPSEALEGKVARTVYHDANTRYLVLRGYIEGRMGAVTLVGRGEALEDGAEFTAQGEWTVHPTHGEQFTFERLVVKMPTTLAGIRRRLERYPGIKEVMAERIVDRFGDDTLTILDKQPRRLLEIDGIGEKTLGRVIEFHESRVGPIVELENRLIELGVSPRFADSIHRRFREQALPMLQSHPYQLPREVRGIGFLTADKIARAVGVDLESPERVEAGLLHVLEQAESDGHCALPRTVLVDKATRLLVLGHDLVTEGAERLIDSGELLVERHESERVEGGEVELCFPREFILGEDNVAHALRDIALSEHEVWDAEAYLPDHLSEGQRAAVEAIANTGVVILTGGPGTGKSTVVHQVIEMARDAGSDLHLCAPTGRAAKRLEQATGESARTVHRLLEIDGETGEFIYHANNPLPVGLVVVDECSMLDLRLAEALLTALTPAHRLMLVGDADQLPSVGPGNVLRDLIEAADQPLSPVEVVRLNQIFRQEDGSSIVVNAHHILHGRTLEPDEGGSGGGQFYVIRASDPQRVHEVVVKMASERIPQVYDLAAREDVQVLCPMHKGQAGTEAFNRALQERYGDGADVLEVGALGRGPTRRFRVGDRVMQTRNDYNRGVFNGDIGVVIQLDLDEKSLVVEFEDTPVSYEGKDFFSLTLAYAISIHKSQGSEFEAVLIPLLGEHHVMLRRNLLYTAVTRARSLCIIVGDPRAIQQAIRRADAAHRHTGLARRLRELIV